MVEKAKKNKKELEQDQKIAELTSDLQRTRADFENYRKRVDQEKQNAKDAGKIFAIMQILPMIDNIERAISVAPENLREDSWVKGVMSLQKNLEKSVESLGIKKIDAKIGATFNPEVHDAIQFDEEAVGESEVIAEVLQDGYLLDGQPIRHAMVKVTRQ